MRHEVSNNYVSKIEFDPVRRLVYGFVSLILVTVIGAILAFNFKIMNKDKIFYWAGIHTIVLANILILTFIYWLIFPNITLIQRKLGCTDRRNKAVVVNAEEPEVISNKVDK